MTEHPPGEKRRGLLAAYHSTPLYLRVLVALVLGVIVGQVWGPGAAPMKEPSRLVLRLLGAVAPPLILIAVIHALMQADLRGRSAGKLIGLLVTNTLVAIGVGLLVANVLRPGSWAKLGFSGEAPHPPPLDAWAEFTDKIPTSLFKPLVDNNVIAVILVALAFGMALRRVREQQQREGKNGYQTVEALVDAAFSALMVVIHWIIDVVPLAVFGIVAAIVGKEGFEHFKALGAFVAAVLLALFLQAVYYVSRVRIQSWVRPRRFLAGGRDALMTAFSTASSTATMPITYACLKDRVGLREESASMGALVGSNFNNDGTALYEAMAAMFIAQVIGQHLTMPQQVALVLTSVVASVGAPGIPEAGLVTMTLVFTAAKLPVQYIPLLLTVDWFLDRCRTAINVMGDMCVSCVLDGKTPKGAEGAEEVEQDTG